MIEPPPTWLSPHGASADAIAALKKAVPGLPPKYLEILQLGNGGEAELQVNPYGLCLDSAEEALDFWSSETCTLKNVFVFGGNGGGSLIAFDMRVSGNYPVIHFDPIDPEGSLQLLATSFANLLTLIDE